MEKIRNENKTKLYKSLKLISRIYKVAGVMLVVVAFGILSSNISPELLYRVDSGVIDENTKTLVSPIIAEEDGPLKVSKYDEDVLGKLANETETEYSTANSLPPFDPSLPKDMTIIIPKIGVYAKVNIGADGEKELDKGVWMPEGFGNPTVEGNKMLFASHRFGYLSWSSQFRALNSFYRLPELRPGDEIIIVYEQRQFKYEVTDRYTSTELTSIKGDILLYTCQFFRGDERVIVDAKRV